MESIKEAYQELTGVDIAEQARIWDERGKGYYGEFLAFKENYLKVKGQGKLIMNLQMPTLQGKATEIDLLLIHETGLYVFEVKHYKGTIYGKDSDLNWTQWFRTAPNNLFRNPILQNKYHIEALRARFPEVPIYSIIVFTNPNCELRLTRSNLEVTVCKAEELHRYLSMIEKKSAVFSPERIDEIFRELMPFSPLTKEKAIYNGQEIPFHLYINAIREDYFASEKKLEEDFFKKKRKAKVITGILCILSVVLCTVVCLQCYLYAQGTVKAAQDELAEFAKKFEHVEPYSGEIDLKEGILTATNVRVEASADVQNATSLSFSVNWHGEDYAARISHETKIVAILKDGSVKEYDLLEKTFPFSSGLFLARAGYVSLSFELRDIPRHELSGVQVNDIAYIKLSGIDIGVRQGFGRFATVARGYELELYCDAAK